MVSLCLKPRRRQPKRCYEAVTPGVRQRRLMRRCYPWRLEPLLAEELVLPRRFFLLERISLDSGAEVIAGATPSGLLPGGGACASGRRSPSSGGGHQGPDRVFSAVSRVFSVNFEATFVIPLCSKGLFVMLYTASSAFGP